MLTDTLSLSESLSLAPLLLSCCCCCCRLSKACGCRPRYNQSFPAKPFSPARKKIMDDLSSLFARCAKNGDPKGKYAAALAQSQRLHAELDLIEGDRYTIYHLKKQTKLLPTPSWNIQQYLHPPPSDGALEYAPLPSFSSQHAAAASKKHARDSSAEKEEEHQSKKPHS